jgi:hypothetical protein
VTKVAFSATHILDRARVSGLCKPPLILTTSPIYRSIAMNLPKSLGMILLAVWLILFGVLSAPALSLSFAYSGDVLAVLAIIAGVVLLLKRD